MDELISNLNVLRIDCNQLKTNCDQKSQQLVKTIEEYAKTVLSITWDQELVITSDDFRTENCEKVMNSILYLLDGIRLLCDELDDNRSTGRLLDNSDYESVRTLLGIDLAECLLWRKAGLLYAFCNCKLSHGFKVTDTSVVIEDDQRLADEEVRHKVLQYLIDGIQWFRLFLSQRQPMDAILSATEPTALRTSESLVRNNIFSDNHLLSLMYLSEMCFWYNKYSTHWSLYLHSDVDSEECAKRCLNLYINAVENHFKPFGWNCDKAKQLLDFIDL